MLAIRFIGSTKEIAEDPDESGVNRAILVPVLIAAN
jgi:hypothetical protein